MTRTSEAPACVVCGKPQQPRYRPFCSKRCADIDLGRWLKGRYRIETEEPPGEEEAEPPRGGHA